MTLFAAEEITATMVMYVALLMLLQLRVAPAEATLLSAMLFVPWILKPFMRPWVKRFGHFGQMVFIVEGLLSAALFFLAFAFRMSTATVFLALLIVSLLCVWHELVACMYYDSTLRPSLQRLLTVPKAICSQAAIIFTYGALIFVVGTLQVYFRQMIRYSWSVGCYVATGIFLLFFLYHFIYLSRSPWREVIPDEDCQDRLPSFKETFRLRRSTEGGCNSVNEGWIGILLLLFLLLPQALMFYARVLYLYDTHEHEGLQCTIQEIGFAQGTVGVIAFNIGIALNRLLLQHYSFWHLFWPMATCLVLSPFVYMGMTLYPPGSLGMLCCCTMSAQILFGLGAGVCRYPVSLVSGNHYHNEVNVLQIPVVSAVMFVPMAVCGWMVERFGYNMFFLVNALSAPACLLVVYLLLRLRRMHPCCYKP